MDFSDRPAACLSPSDLLKNSETKTEYENTFAYRRYNLTISNRDLWRDHFGSTAIVLIAINYKTWLIIQYSKKDLLSIDNKALYANIIIIARHELNTIIFDVDNIRR